MRFAKELLSWADLMPQGTDRITLYRNAASRIYYCVLMSSYRHLVEVDQCPLVVFDDAVTQGSYGRSDASQKAKKFAAGVMNVSVAECEIGWRAKYKAGSHRFIIDAFRCETAPRRRINVLLDKLRVLRTTADYESLASFTAEEVERMISDAEKILSDLAALRTRKSKEFWCSPCGECASKLVVALKDEAAKRAKRRAQT